MARIEKTIELNVDSKDAEKGFDKLADAIKELNQTFNKFQKTTEDGFEGVKEGSEKASKGVNKVGKTLKSIGSGAGVFFLLSKAFEFFKSVGEKNQKVLDLFNTTFEFLSIAFNDFFNFIFDNAGGVVDTFKAIFNDPVKAIKDFGKSIYDGIIVRFNELVQVTGLIGNSFMKLIKGDFKGAFETIKEAGKQTVDVFTGVDNSFDGTVEKLKDLGNSVVEYGKSTLKAAQDNVELANAAEIAAAQQSLLVEKYDRQAEQLRQIRDEERNSISERKKANDELLLVLEQQEKAMLATADAQLKSAQAEAAKNNSIENQVAVTEALANRLGVLAQIEGFRSEQKANDLALDREQIELTNSKAESESNLSIERKRFNAEQIEDELARLEALKEIDLLEAEQEGLRLQAIVDNANAETQAKIDAEIALNEFNEQSRQTNLQREKEISDAKVEISKAEAEAKSKNLANTENALNSLGALAGEQTAAGKGLAIASATINTYRGVSDALAAKTVTPFETALKFVNAAAILGNGLKNVQKIASVKIPKTSGGGGGVSGSAPSGGAAPAPPSFNVVGASETSVLADTVAEQTNEPVQAYVVSNDVTTAQSLENNIVEGATI
jgi:hypothetical protein